MGLSYHSKVRLKKLDVFGRKIIQIIQKWFDGKVAEKLRVRDKLFKKFKKWKLSIDKETNEIF